MIFFYDVGELDFVSYAENNAPYSFLLYSCLSDKIFALGLLKGGIDKIFF